MVECLAGKKVLIKGNYAIANAAVLAGCQCYFGYPITPQSEIGEFMSGKMQELGRAYVSAESELAAINMTLGACSTGVKSNVFLIFLCSGTYAGSLILCNGR